MAIDQEIQSKVDAYRGNPQQLMQRYQQNQQLVDLLALQKLKSEKEAAARDMQLQMQQQPQTIKQQREAELLNMTKQEMMQQTQGVLQQRWLISVQLRLKAHRRVSSCLVWPKAVSCRSSPEVLLVAA